MDKIVTMKCVGKQHYEQPDVELKAEDLTIRRTTFNGDSAFDVCFNGKKIGSVALNLNKYDINTMDVVNKNALNNAIEYEIIKWEDHSWGGYMKVKATYVTKLEKQLRIAHDWGAFKEARKHGLTRVEEYEWIMKILNHNPIKPVAIKELLIDCDSYEIIDEFIKNFSMIHEEVYEKVE